MAFLMVGGKEPPRHPKQFLPRPNALKGLARLFAESPRGEGKRDHETKERQPPGERARERGAR